MALLKYGEDANAFLDLQMPTGRVKVSISFRDL